MKNYKKLLYFVPMAVWMIVIFAFSAQPAELSNMNNSFIIMELQKIGIDLTVIFGKDLANFLVRKAAHLTEYAALYLLSYLGLCRNGKRSRLFPLLIVFLYAGSDEMHQLFIPGRAGRFRDVLIDTCGGAAGLLLTFIGRKKSKQTEQKLYDVR